MTGAEIIKAMECCIDIGINACDDCPFQERCVTGEFIETEAIDLINTQKAEIEKLKEQVNLWQEEASSVGCENEWLKACLKEKNAEIERLTKLCNEQNAEIKRLIEVKNRLFYSLKLVCEEKEMVGESNV